MSEDEANLLVESSKDILYLMGIDKVNLSRSTIGVQSMCKIYQHYEGCKLETDLPVVLINLDKVFHHITKNQSKMSQERFEKLVFSYVRKWWKFGDKKGNAKYAVAVYRGWTIAAYRIDRWIAPKHQKFNKRWKFKGEIIQKGNHIHRKLVNKITYANKENYRTPQNPISYRNCTKVSSDFIFRYNNGIESALIYPKNEQALNVLSLFADKYKWKVYQINAVYFERENEQEYYACYLVQNQHNQSDFSQNMDIIRKYLLMPFKYPLNIQEQVAHFFNCVSNKPFQYISACYEAHLYKAGNISGMWCRDMRIKEIVKRLEMGKNLQDIDE
ncbi:hypothetical protein E5Q53_03075 [Haemophilus parahaemolyticus]|uniref:Uncharacterized protein n=2 Tax=Haemophilus parahaemolyticus TaxID=735 RepID=A0AAE6JQK2_HAEPH|nr:hypothetical protein [Haemophilus parahaemolyticus]EIJ70288.1 hypothetical protein HMPREF1050_1268 [Haemophilus parahaemolyticus HK385]OOR95018.1 hypothetical protein B0185_08650 [Haemophilus parahaemolyticus]QEN10522.1 hypothetical protein E5Q53_03075 [Haemophilus parahaemolyticus]QRP11716.1 hypothetical protein I6J29_05060 [Haemophilus parahaemolyticus]RDE81894.1 hypothetical protein DPV86_05480 [Haemophilus parahaemolyticus]